MENAAVKRFLADTDPRLMTEAARAINDVPIRAGMPDLAALLTLDRCPTNAVTRAINAAFRLGGAEHAKTVAAYAARTNVPAALRVEALEALRDWGRPSPLDRVMGLWRPGVE
jgi:quinoprotein glucose dehydrogenase